MMTNTIAFLFIFVMKRFKLFEAMEISRHVQLKPKQMINIGKFKARVIKKM